LRRCFGWYSNSLIEANLAAAKETHEAALKQKETELEEWEAKCQRLITEKQSSEAKTIEVLQQDQLARHDEISELDVMPFDRNRGVASLPRRFLRYREESNVHAAKFNAGWSAADFDCKPASETSEEEEDDEGGDDDDDGDEGDEGDDDYDDTDLSGHAPPSTIVDASTPHLRRSPRGLRPAVPIRIPHLLPLP
jgi:TATA-binding protein-associated factor Taf7